MEQTQIGRGHVEPKCPFCFTELILSSMERHIYFCPSCEQIMTREQIENYHWERDRMDEEGGC